MLVSDLCILLLSIIILYMIFKNNIINGFAIGGAVEDGDITIQFDTVNEKCTITEMNDRDGDGTFEEITTKQKDDCCKRMPKYSKDPDVYYRSILECAEELDEKYKTINHEDIKKQVESPTPSPDLDTQMKKRRQNLENLNIIPDNSLD